MSPPLLDEYLLIDEILPSENQITRLLSLLSILFAILVEKYLNRQSSWVENKKSCLLSVSKGFSFLSWTCQSSVHLLYNRPPCDNGLKTLRPQRLLYVRLRVSFGLRMLFACAATRSF